MASGRGGGARIGLNQVPYFSCLTTRAAESLQVSAELEAEFEQALQYRMTDEDLERARLLLGVDTASRDRELYSIATADAIRNWALGVGDDNPLYTDEEYGADHSVGHPDRPRHA